MFKKLRFSSGIGNFLGLKHAFCHGLSVVIFSHYMTPTDVTGIKHINIRPTDRLKYTQNQFGRQVYYPDFHTRKVLQRGQLSLSIPMA